MRVVAWEIWYSAACGHRKRVVWLAVLKFTIRVRCRVRHEFSVDAPTHTSILQCDGTLTTLVSQSGEHVTRIVREGVVERAK
jgi:hypothetical protein